LVPGHLDVTGTDRTQVIRASEVVSADLPGDLAAAASRLLRRLASDVVAQVVKPGKRSRFFHAIPAPGLQNLHTVVSRFPPSLGFPSEARHSGSARLVRSLGACRE